MYITRRNKLTASVCNKSYNNKSVETNAQIDINSEQVVIEITRSFEVMVPWVRNTNENN